MAKKISGSERFDDYYSNLGKKPAGAERFENYYGKLYGERWPELKASLIKPAEMTAFTEGLLQPYYMDQASFVPPNSLDVKPGEDVLDVCAAPGGKTLILAVKLKGSGGLTSNDISPDRRRRLKNVISDHLPAEWRKSINITGWDGSRIGMNHKEAYDKILLDVPCSSERHVLNSPYHLDQWSPGRSKNLTIRQFALLASAFDALKPEGILVYSTCSLNPQENDGIIDKLFRKRKDLFEVVKKKPPFGEETQHGWALYPDKLNGIGPIFFSVIKRIRSIPS